MRNKETEGGQKAMCEIMDKIAREARLEGRAEGIIEFGREVGLTEEQILERLRNRLSITKEEAEGYMKGFST